jgi:hypothetical protein
MCELSLNNVFKIKKYRIASLQNNGCSANLTTYTKIMDMIKHQKFHLRTNAEATFQAPKSGVPCGQRHHT